MHVRPVSQQQRRQFPHDVEAHVAIFGLRDTHALMHLVQLLHLGIGIVLQCSHADNDVERVNRIPSLLTHTHLLATLQLGVQ